MGHWWHWYDNIIINWVHIGLPQNAGRSFTMKENIYFVKLFRKSVLFSYKDWAEMTGLGRWNIWAKRLLNSCLCQIWRPFVSCVDDLGLTYLNQENNKKLKWR